MVRVEDEEDENYVGVRVKIRDKGRVKVKVMVLAITQKYLEAVHASRKCLFFQANASPQHFRLSKKVLIFYDFNKQEKR